MPNAENWRGWEEMKSLIKISIFSAVMLLLPFSPVIRAQDSKSYFVGARASVKADAPTYGWASFGLSLPLGSGMYSITDFNGGQGGSSVAEHVAVLWSLSGTFHAGLLAGGGIEWKPGGLPVDYLKGTAGGLAVLDVSPTSYLWLAGKRESDFDSDNLFKARWQFGLGFGKKFL